MSLIRKFRADHYARQLRSSDGLTAVGLDDVKSRIIALGPSAIQPMFKLLANSEARRPALDVLERLLNDETLHHYLEALASRDPVIGGGATEVLARSRRYDPVSILDLFSDPAVPKSRLEAILSEQVEKLPPKLLVSMVADLPGEARPSVFRILEKRVDESIVPEAVRNINNPDWWVRQHMIRLVGDLRAREGATAIIGRLDDEHTAVRLESVRALGRIRPVEAIPGLCGRLRDGDLKVHTAAIDALISIGDISMVPHLVDVLKDESEHARRAAVEVLNQVITVEAIKDLVTALRDEDWWVRVRAADALGSLGGEKVVDAVVGLLEDEDDFIRRYAVEILNTVPDSRAVEPLIRALGDPDWWVRERAIDALARTGDSRAVEPLLTLIAEDRKAAPLCARALGEIGDPGAIDTLVYLMNADNAEIKREAGQALVALTRKTLDPQTRGQVVAILEQAGLRPESPGKKPLDVRARSEDMYRSSIRKVDRKGAAPAPDPGTSGLAAPASPAAGAAAQPARNYQDIPPDTVLVDRYKVMRKIGGGGFGTVYLAQDTLVKDEIIIKVLSPYLSVDESVIMRFMRELRLTRRISHPNVIRIHDFIDLGGGHAISMEYFRGADLSKLLRSGPLPWERVVRIGAQICNGLAAAHDLGIFHRDIKPANILVGEEDRVKIVDFGLAGVGQQAGSRLTKSGLLIGTPEYIAPEQIKGDPADNRADIYSLGVVLYELLVGTPPFSGDNTVNLLFRHIEADYRPLAIAAPDVPAEVAHAVAAAMAREPGDRPATALELKALLVEAEKGDHAQNRRVS